MISAIASVEGFRNGAAKLAESSGAEGAGDHMSIWSRPIPPEQIDRYHATYRSAKELGESHAVMDLAHAEDADQPVAA
ncbi:MAG: hypothetical protein M3Y83_00635 [Actinomycetota bacterium]|nr:hypothetical protein [Actinomycetota bacterium]